MNAIATSVPMRGTKTAPQSAPAAGSATRTPGARLLAARRVALGIGRRRVREAARVRKLSALPVKLHLDAMLAVGRQRLLGLADDEGAGRARCRRLAHERRDHGRGRRGGVEVIEVAALLDVAVSLATTCFVA